MTHHTAVGVAPISALLQQISGYDGLPVGRSCLSLTDWKSVVQLNTTQISGCHKALVDIHNSPSTGMLRNIDGRMNGRCPTRQGNRRAQVPAPRGRFTIHKLGITETLFIQDISVLNKILPIKGRIFRKRAISTLVCRNPHTVAPKSTHGEIMVVRGGLRRVVSPADWMRSRNRS